jgi:hypothetical protein
MTTAVDECVSTCGAAAMAWPGYKADERMQIADLRVESGLDIDLPAGEWVCLGLVLSLEPGTEKNDREHFFLLKLVQVGAGEYAVCICDGIDTNGKLEPLEGDALKLDGDGVYVAFGLYVDSQLFTNDFARPLTGDELEKINLGKQRENSCAFNSVCALLALNRGLVEMLALGGALTAASADTIEARAMRTLQHCVFFGKAEFIEENNANFVEVVARSLRRADGMSYNEAEVQDCADLLHDVLWMLWGKLKQSDWGGGKVTIANCSNDFHRAVMLDKHLPLQLDPNAAAHILESWVLAELSTAVIIAVHQTRGIGCPADLLEDIQVVEQHLAKWACGPSNSTVPTAVSEALCRVTTGATKQGKQWILGWFFEVLARKCGYESEMSDDKVV